MALSAQNLLALRAAVFADATAAPLLEAGDAAGLRSYLNAASNPAFTVWRSGVTREEILQNGFDWTRLDNLSVGAARVWADIFVNGIINPSKANVRAGIDAVWKGNAPDLAVRAAVYVHCKRIASNAEKMLGTGTGSDAVPGNLGYEGEISDLESALLIFHDDGTIWTAQG